MSPPATRVQLHGPGVRPGPQSRLAAPTGPAEDEARFLILCSIAQASVDAHFAGNPKLCLGLSLGTAHIFTTAMQITVVSHTLHGGCLRLIRSSLQSSAATIAASTVSDGRGYLRCGQREY